MCRYSMGNEESTMVDEATPPHILERRSIESVAKYIKEKNVKRIVVMVSIYGTYTVLERIC